LERSRVQTNEQAVKIITENSMDIVHLDMKPHNILLRYSESSEALQHSLPEVYLADFGIAFELRKKFSNPQDFWNHGTHSCVAPEVIRHVNTDKDPHTRDQTTGPISRATNVYGVSCILYSLIRVDGGPHEDVEGERKILHIGSIRGNTGKLECGQGSAQFFLEELKTLIKEYVLFRPEARPSLHEPHFQC
jgi:serine/threonine protein kinase